MNNPDPIRFDLASGGQLWLLSLSGFGDHTDRRQKEQAGVRRLIETALEKPSELAHEACGRPMLTGIDSAPAISISHTTDWAALLVCPGTQACGVDIEHLGRNVEHLTARFCSETERRIAEPLCPENPALLVWCAKEAVYKMTESEGADFRCDLELTAGNEHTLTVRFKTQHISLSYFQVQGLLVVCGAV